MDTRRATKYSHVSSQFDATTLSAFDGWCDCQLAGSRFGIASVSLRLGTLLVMVGCRNGSHGILQP